MARKRATRRQVVACPRCGFESAPAAGPVNFCPDCGTDLRPAGGADGQDETTGAFVTRVIADRYRLDALLGEGGMGAVYRAEHIRMGKTLALKILRGEFARQPGAAERFLAEARIVSLLSHPHTIAVFDFGELDREGSGFYLAMEYVPGKDLAAVLRESGRLPERRVAEIGQQVLGSLAEAHDAGVVHRDVKPGNVMLMQTRSGEDFVKVLDFGIAKLKDAAAGAEGVAGATTGAGDIVGTPNYLAPEQARGEPIDGRSDLYALGCVLYELAAGKPPFAAPSPFAVVAAHLHDEPPPLTRVAPVSRGLAEVVHRALRKRPADRFASADEMRDALRALTAPGGPRRKAAAPRDVTGELRIASREDFATLDRRVRALRPGRLVARAAALLALGAAGAGLWHLRAEILPLLAAHAPRLAAALPPSLRPAAGGGADREPNDGPEDASPVPLAGGAGSGTVRGRIGASGSAAGDVDVYRVELPPAAGHRVLVATWRGEAVAEGGHAVDVSLALNRAVPPEAARGSAPHVASVDRGGPGAPETLAAAVEPGTYYLSVRERAGARPGGPVPYLLEIRIEDARPGEELEPNDGPAGPAAPRAGDPGWQTVAARNPLGEGVRLRGEAGPGDLDVYALELAGTGRAPEVVIAIPEPGLALGARLWRPDPEDLAAAQPEAPVRFEEAGEAPPGQVVAVSPGGRARPGAPALLQLRAVSGQGRYELVALGPGAASAEAVLASARALAEAGRTPAALELAAAFAARVPAAADRDDVLRLAGAIAAGAAPALAADGVGAFDRAALLLGAAIFDVDAGKVAYRGAFERRAAPAAGGAAATLAPEPSAAASAGSGAP